MAEGSSKGGGNGIKIALVVALLAAAGGIYWYTTGGSGGKQPVSAADNVSDEVKQQNEQIQKDMENLPEEVIGGS